MGSSFATERSEEEITSDFQPNMVASYALVCLLRMIPLFQQPIKVDHIPPATPAAASWVAVVGMLEAWHAKQTLVLPATLWYQLSLARYRAQ